MQVIYCLIHPCDYIQYTQARHFAFMKWGDYAAKNGIHRQTCQSLMSTPAPTSYTRILKSQLGFTLYRALLRQCSKVSASICEKDSLLRIVKDNFKKNKRILSPTKTIHSLQAGYEVWTVEGLLFLEAKKRLVIADLMHRLWILCTLHHAETELL